MAKPKTPHTPKPKPPARRSTPERDQLAKELRKVQGVKTRKTRAGVPLTAYRSRVAAALTSEVAEIAWRIEAKRAAALAKGTVARAKSSTPNVQNLHPAQQSAFAEIGRKVKATRAETKSRQAAPIASGAFHPEHGIMHRLAGSQAFIVSRLWLRAAAEGPCDITSEPAAGIFNTHGQAFEVWRFDGHTWLAAQTWIVIRALYLSRGQPLPEWLL